MKFQILLLVFVTSVVSLTKAASCGDDRPPYNQPSKFIKVNITWWRQLDGNPANLSANVEVTVPRGSNFYQAMQIAQVADGRFSFETTYTPGVGHVISSINGLPQGPPENRYWMLYLMPGPPVPSEPPSKAFIQSTVLEETTVNDKDNFLLWLHYRL